MPRSKPWRMLYGTLEKESKRSRDRSSCSQVSAIKGVMMMRKSDDGGAGLGIVNFVATEGASMFLGTLIEGAVTVFPIPTEAVLTTIVIGVRDV